MSTLSRQLKINIPKECLWEILALYNLFLHPSSPTNQARNFSSTNSTELAKTSQVTTLAQVILTPHTFQDSPGSKPKPTAFSRSPRTANIIFYRGTLEKWKAPKNILHSYFQRHAEIGSSPCVARGIVGEMDAAYQAKRPHEILLYHLLDPGPLCPRDTGLPIEGGRHWS